MYTLNGTGTRLYGKEKINPDGSYISTKWITFFWIPLIPLGSFRVWKGSSQKAGFITFGTETKYHLQKVALSIRQVLSVYSIVAIVLAVMGIIGYLFER